jgi:putative molybdopterin biosynthesis protein
VHRLQLHYTLSRQAGEETIGNPLFALLQALAREGSISSAARAMGLSYRHVWGELRRWEEVLGQGLVVWDKGQSARLTEFGDKLMWAERQAQARLAPQIAALRSELERAFAVAFDPETHVLILFASHDDALAAFSEHALGSRPVDAPAAALHLDIRFSGSVDAIRALNEGRCTLAGFHALERSGAQSVTARHYKALLRPGRHKIIGFARRWQGLLVAPGNPLGLRRIEDLTRPGLRYVNRALGTGTRVVFEELLRTAGLPSASMEGYARTEPSHGAVAQAIASGSADAGLGIASAAAAHGLDFIPLAQERYWLVCLKSELEQPATQALLALLRTPGWQQQLAAMPGYQPADSGEVLSLRECLPWWSFRTRRSETPRKGGPPPGARIA